MKILGGFFFGFFFLILWRTRITRSGLRGSGHASQRMYLPAMLIFQFYSQFRIWVV